MTGYGACGVRYCYQWGVDALVDAASMGCKRLFCGLRMVGGCLGACGLGKLGDGLRHSPFKLRIASLRMFANTILKRHSCYCGMFTDYILS